MSALHRWTLPALLALASTALGGCFFIDDPDWRGYDPVIYDTAETYWLCDYDAAAHDYYWEYQASVHDPDGNSDIRFVDVEFYSSYDGAWVDTVSLFDEGGGIWGAWSMERETNLFCGEAYDAVFYAEDYAGNSDSLVVSNYTHAPVISESPSQTWTDCYDDGMAWVFEFQALVDDGDGFDDVDYVTVSFYEYSTGLEAGTYTLNAEGGGYWGGWIEEGNGNSLYCGERYEVVFYAEDYAGNWDRFSYVWQG